MDTKETLPEYNGRSAYGGALRFRNPDDLSWQETWGISYGPLLPDIRIFAADAFGVMYGFDRKGQVVIFWSESGEIEELGFDEETFYTLIKEDPEATINWPLYKQAIEKLGELPLNEDFAFKIELALGGNLTVSNIERMDSILHMQALGEIAQQLIGVPYGTAIDKVEAYSSIKSVLP